MNYYSVRDLRSQPKVIWERLSSEGEVVITNNGRPAALMIDLSQDDLEETIAAVRQARVMMAVNEMRAHHNAISEEEIAAEIKAAREEVGNA